MCSLHGQIKWNIITLLEKNSYTTLTKLQNVADEPSCSGTAVGDSPISVASSSFVDGNVLPFDNCRPSYEFFTCIWRNQNRLYQPFSR